MQQNYSSLERNILVHSINQYHNFKENSFCLQKNLIVNYSVFMAHGNIGIFVLLITNKIYVIPTLPPSPLFSILTNGKSV